MLKRFAVQAVAVLAVGLQTGCMTRLQELDERAVTQQLQVGQTPEEVRWILGRPKRTLTGSNGKQLDWFMAKFPRRHPSRLPNLDVRCVSVLYDTRGRVERFTHSVGELKWGTGAKGDQPLGAEQIQKIQPGVTTVADLAEWFGAATATGLDFFGNQGMAWYFVTARQHGAPTGRELTVWFDADSRVRDFGIQEFQP